MARFNFTRMATEKLSEVLGLSYENAAKVQRRLYRQTLRRYDKEERPFKTSRELYYSLVTPNKKNAPIKFSQDFLSIDKVDKMTAREVLKTRMKKLINKTGGMKGEVGSAINEYLKENISYKEFKERVAKYKRSAEYESKQKEKVNKKKK